MSKYRFNIQQTIYGYIDAEIGEQDPEEYIEELIDLGITARDFTYIRDDDTECDDWDELRKDIAEIKK